MIKTRFIDGVKIIKLNRIEKFHSFTRELAFKLIGELEKSQNDESIRAIMITAEGKAFCAGQDLNEAVEDNGLDIERIISEHYNPLILKIRNLSKPVIAAVNGVAAGAGASLALCCDLIVAKKSAKFVQAFSKIGLIPDSGSSYFLPRLVGFQKAKALMITGESISAVEAEKIGMIYKYYEDDDFEKNSLNLAKNIASQATLSFSLIKKLVNESYDNNLENQLELEKKLQKIASESTDYKEGVNAFLNKKKPKFIGK